MKIIVAGAWQWPWYEKAFSNALTQLGNEVIKFSWAEKFVRFTSERVEPVPLSKLVDLQRRAIFGRKVLEINRSLINYIDKYRPQCLLLYRATHVWPRTLRTIKQISPHTLLVQYCNDNPFSPNASSVLWRYLKKAIPIYDLHFVYREQNISDFNKAGAKRVVLLRSYFISDQNYRVALDKSDDIFLSDVLFAGHFENDFRSSYLEEVIKMGFKLNLFGGGWEYYKSKLKPNSPLLPLFPVSPVVDEEYRKAISGTKIALCFLSKLNCDTYTRRNFEIPATGTFMLSEYSEDLASLFEEGYDAEFFRSKEEFINKIKYYIKNDSRRESIARNGYYRVLNDGHDIVSRAREALEEIQKLK